MRFKSIMAFFLVIVIIFPLFNQVFQANELQEPALDESESQEIVFQGVLLQEQKAQTKIIQEQIVHYRRITRVINTGVEANLDGEVEVLLLPASVSQYQGIFEERITPKPERIMMDQEGNRYAQIKLPPLKKNEGFDIIYECNLLSRTNNQWSLSQLEEEIENLEADHEIFLSPERKADFLKDEKYIEPSHLGINELAQALTAEDEDQLSIALRIFEYVNTTLEYDDSIQYARKGSVSAFYNNRGICTDFAALTVALLRAKEIPSRMMGGYILIDYEDKDLVSGSDVAHAWVEFFIDGIGWLPADPTHIAYLNDERVVAEDYFISLADWGYIVTSYGVEASQYRIRTEHLGGASLTGQIADTFIFSHRHLNDEIHVLINQNSRVLFPDAKPIITPEYRTFVPLRMLLEAFGASVEYDGKGNKVLSSFLGRQLEISVGSDFMLLDGEEVSLGFPSYIDKETWRTMIPLRAFVEALGIEVQWVPKPIEILLIYE